MTEKLKPCPFCGSEARLWHPKEYGITLGSIKCPKCGASTETYTDDYSAIEGWNNRINPWHTGTPTEEGWYLLAYKYGGGTRIYYEVIRWEGIWKDEDIGWDAQKVQDLAYCKIEPYKETE